ncbi:hypothetical protein [uncultured Erythrobacter sp.]|uniref:hypothetical protein n=1 Tax=uncultured Erythrobacter sp. TaxID=263913 RepID=UPI0026083A9D|nr:hypothetical protein [uncultured Erythrobacter sp.]
MRILIASLVVAGALAAPASSREVDRQEVAEVFASDVAQEQRLYCRDTRLFTLADGREVHACIDWRAQNRTRLVRSYAALEGPEVDADENLDLARTCFELAVASQNDPNRTEFDPDQFLAGAREHFALCARTNALQQSGEYSLNIYERGVWLGAN